MNEAILWWERVKAVALLIGMFVFCMMISYWGYRIVFGDPSFRLHAGHLIDRAVLFGSAIGYAVGIIAGFAGREDREKQTFVQTID